MGASSSFRARTSALQWHHYQLQQQQQQPSPPSLSGCRDTAGWPTSVHGRKQQQLQQQQQQDELQQLKRSQSWLVPANCTSSVAAAGEHWPRPPTGRPLGAPPDGGGGSIADQQSPPPGDADPGTGGGGGGQRRPAPGSSSFLCSLLWAASALAGWRARRKESDKASSIQQHLRAIRHAENLDRQTHFRRSQVQRLVQRFDSTGAQFIEQLQHHTSGPSGRKLSPQPAGAGAELVDWPRGEDAERLLAVLAQLIGGQNVWRLVETLRRHSRQAEMIGARESSAELILAPDNWRSEGALAQMSPLLPDDRGQQQQQQQRRRRLLDLCKLSDRRLALALLKFLAELARNAIGQIQIGVCLEDQLAPDMLQRPLTLDTELDDEQSQQQPGTHDETARDSRPVQDNGHDNCSPLEVVDSDDSSRLGARQQCKIVQQAGCGTTKPDSESACLSQRHWSRKGAHEHRTTDKRPAPGDKSGPSRQPADNREIMSAPFVAADGGRPQSRTAQKMATTQAPRTTTTTTTTTATAAAAGYEDDPIRRTLECIMGTKGSPLCAATPPQKLSPSILGQRLNGSELGASEGRATITDDRAGRTATAAAPTHRMVAGSAKPAASDTGSRCASDGKADDGPRGVTGARASASQQGRQSDANELHAAGQTGRPNGESGGQVIGQSINGQSATNHRNPGACESQACRYCCSECPARRPLSRGRCCPAAKSSGSPGRQQQQRSAEAGPGEPTAPAAGSSCCCCSRSGCGRLGRRRHRARSDGADGWSVASKEQRARSASKQAQRNQAAAARSTSSSAPASRPPLAEAAAATTKTAKHLRNIQQQQQQQTNKSSDFDHDCEDKL